METPTTAPSTARAAAAAAGPGPGGRGRAGRGGQQRRAAAVARQTVSALAPQPGRQRAPKLQTCIRYVEKVPATLSGADRWN
jgi:hypothetical protein